jgi:selenocysteine lyase/cysteine desulfurase
MDWRAEWFEFDDVAFLNAAGQGPLPRVSVRAVQAALEWKKYPHKLPDAAYFELPDRIRALVARLVGGQPEEVALTTGASGGLAAVAAGIEWKPEDEVLMAQGEFPAHFSTWMPLDAARRLRVVVISPRGRFISADDFLAHIGPRTRLVSTSLVRFDDSARLDAARLAQTCHAAGAYLLLDVSQCVGAMPLDVDSLGADFMVSAGYKWLLSPYGTGFFWAQGDLIEKLRVGPFYWMALEGAAEFHRLPLRDWKLARGARRWDSPETASFFNLSAMQASLEFLLRVGVQTIWEHNRRLIGEMVERLPLDRCVLASPGESDARGPYASIAARSPEKTAALYEKLRAANVIVSLRENTLRVAPHLYNTERDIDRLLAIAAG